MYAKRFWIIAFVLSLLLVPATTVRAQDGAEIPEVTFEATAEGFVIPAEVPAGVVRVIVANNSETPISALFIRLNEGVTLDTLMTTLEQEGEEAATPLVTFLGGSDVMPGATNEAIYDLVPGTYLFADESGDEPALEPFTVVESEGEIAVAPEADIEIELVDFAFNVPLAIDAGPHVWHVENTGDQPHHMIVVPLDDSMTPGDFNAMLMGLLAGEDVTAPEPILGWAPMSPGEDVWLTYDLEPGTYAVVCVLPDAEGSGHVHAELGMRQFITVQE